MGHANAINIPTPSLPGGMPIRANGTVTFKVSDYVKLIDKIAGVRESYYVEDVSLRIRAVLDQLLMKWISREGKDMFNLQANSFEIAEGIKTDLGMQLFDNGLTVTGFNIMSFNYPEEIQARINKTASHSMVGDLGRYQQIELTDGMASGKLKGGGTAADMAGVMIGMNAANQMLKNMNKQAAADANVPIQSGQAKPNFCPNCGVKTGGANFCPNCGQKLI